MSTQDLRRAFINYFKKHRHATIASSSVIPHEDPTLLFTNAGMNQFKDVFLGENLRDYTRAVSSQKCVRVGGKHNDLDNVGHTSRHLTFFEMLGNFSFGDYFKKEAIQFAWEVATEVFGLEGERIYPTVFQEDDEAFELWKAYVPEKRITRFGEKENFWAMGDTGPCGPCSELLYDRGSHYGSALSPSQDTSGERFLEFWNLVFMQYNRSSEGKMVPLPKPSIDTGSGLERVMSLKMGVESVFETDVLRGLIAQMEMLSGIPYLLEDAVKAPAFRVIADHIRTLAFAIADGAQPSNVDRGYILRKVLRRAVRYGRQLGMEEPFLARVLPRLVESMGPDYPELKKAENRIAEILTQEEEGFFRTLKRGGALLSQVIERAKAKGEISGDDAFKLKDTYGLPLEEILLLAKDGSLTVDEKRFQALELEAKQRSKVGQKNVEQLASESSFLPFLQKEGPTHFSGYTSLHSHSLIKGLMKEGQFVDSLQEGEEGVVILDKTPFYAEMGGQVGDTGQLSSSKVEFSVTDTRAPFKGVIAHIGFVKKGTLKKGDSLEAKVNENRRQKIANNHTATHLMHYALQKVLGEHIKQAGSVVDEERLRFDFSHHKALTMEEIRAIEDIVNQMIRGNHSVEWYEIPYEEAKDRPDIKQFFGEKYGSSVRVVATDQSKELCGGTHTTRLGNIGYFKIAKESSIAAGVRRIEAVTGKSAEDIARESEDNLLALAQLLKAPVGKVNERLEKMIQENKALTTSLKGVRQEEINRLRQKLLDQKEVLRDVSLVASEVSLNVEELRNMAEDMITHLPSGIILLGSSIDGKAQLYLRISDDLVKKGLQASAIIRDLAALIEGSGGGKPQGATAGGKCPEKIPLALLKIRDYIP